MSWTRFARNILGLFYRNEDADDRASKEEHDAYKLGLGQAEHQRSIQAQKLDEESTD